MTATNHLFWTNGLLYEGCCASGEMAVYGRVDGDDMNANKEVKIQCTVNLKLYQGHCREVSIMARDLGFEIISFY